jgi:hypothetical protein
MFRNVLPGIENVDWYGILSLLIFFTFFTFMSIYVWRMKRADIQVLENLPLEEENQLNNTKNENIGK